MVKSAKMYEIILEEDSRVGEILKNLPNFYLGKSFGNN